MTAARRSTPPQPLTHGIVLVRAMLAAIRSARLTSAILALLIAGAGLFTTLTAGRTAATQAAVLASINTAEMRTIALIGSAPAGFDAQLVDDVAGYSVVETAIGLGPVRDFTAAVLPQGNRVAGRTLYLPSSAKLQPPPDGNGLPPSAIAGPGALAALGVQTARASIIDVDSGEELFVTGTRTLPDALQTLGPQLLLPRRIATEKTAARSSQPLGTLLVTAKRVQDVEPLLPLLQSHVADLGGQVKVQPPEQISTLHSAIAGELTRGNRIILLGTFVAAALTTSIVVWTVVLLRRRDYGRRRALGASRGLILRLTVLQVVGIALPAGMLGVLGAVCWLMLSGAPVPPPDFLLALPVSLSLMAALAALLPAWWAARRDPLTELRTP